MYLRSFANDVRTTESWKLTDDQGREVSTSDGSPKEALEGLLKEAGPLIEVGGRYNSGLGQVKVANEDWWEEAVSRIIHSTANFLNPGTSDGLTKETELILKHEKLLRRTFLIMEPTDQTMFSAIFKRDRTAAKDREARWNTIVVSFRDCGIELPDYDAHGAIISLYAPDRWQKFTGIERTQLYDLMQKELYVDLEKRGSYDLLPDEPCPCGSTRPYGECHAHKMPGS